MTHKLILTYKPENEFDGELCAAIESECYSGHGAAWFSVDQLHSFCAALNVYPISSDTPPSLKGGYWSDDGTVLTRTHVGLTIAPYDVRGSLLVSVQLSSPVWELESQDLHRSVVAHFCTDYPSIDRFRASVLALLASQTDAATLLGQ